MPSQRAPGPLARPARAVHLPELRRSVRALPGGGPELIIGPAQSRVDNPNISDSWKIEIVE